VTTPLNSASTFTQLQKTLRAQCGRGLATAVKRWRYRFSQDRDAPPLSAESARFLIRYGALDAGMEDAARQAAYEKLLSAISRNSGEAPGVAAAWLQLFAAGEYGLLETGVCAEKPQCDACGLKENCRYLSAGGSDARQSGADLARELTEKSAEGADAHRNAELLSFLLHGERSGAAAIARTEALLQRLGGLRGVFDADAKALAQAGVEKAECARVAALARLCASWAAELAERGRAFRSGSDFFEHYHLRLRELKQEVFLVAQLDNKNRLIGENQVSLGTLNETLVHPREVFAGAIQNRAASIALIHNHPSGDPTPSAADKAITRRLDAVAKVVGIRLLDHVIVGDGRFVSFVDQNLMGG
jgi:DNA repair protein RadC